MTTISVTAKGIATSSDPGTPKENLDRAMSKSLPADREAFVNTSEARVPTTRPGEQRA
jgi:hypothetical protein